MIIETVSFSRSETKCQEYADKGLKKQIDAGNMTEEDATYIKMFVEHLEAEADISKSRVYKVENTLSNIARFMKTPFASNTIVDVYAGVSALKSGNRIISGNMKKVGKLSPNTVQDYVKQLKRFYVWLIDEGYCTTISKDKIKAIKNPSGNKLTKTADQMLSEEDVANIVKCCSSIRHKALISTLYESGCRIHEIGNLKWKDLTFDKNFAKLTTNGKTGIPRTIPLTTSRIYLAEWRSNYPGVPEGDNPVFITQDNKSYTYAFMKKTIYRLIKRAGITKKVTPHTFRHSRITNLIRQGVPQSVVCRLMWGKPDSDMINTYLHLTDVDSEREIGKLAGIDIEEEKENEMRFVPHTCSRCLHVNPPESMYCCVCGASLTEETVADLDSMKEEIHADPRYLKILEELEEKVKKLEELRNYL